MPHVSHRVVLPVFTVLALASAAGAQTALGDGRGLERNPQVGSGGRNYERPSVQDQIRINNAIITGNAPQGRSFRGSLGYGATNDFRARAGSDDLYAFRRDAAFSGLFGTGVRGTDALRYQFALSTGQSLPSGFSRLSGYIPRESVAAGGATGASIPSNASIGALRSTAEFAAVRSVRPTLVGGRLDNQGYEWTVQASPLTGVNWTRSANPVIRVGPGPDPQAQYDLGAVISDQTPRQVGTRFVPGSTGLEPAATGIDGVLDRESLRGGSDRADRPNSGRITPIHQKVLSALSEPISTRIDPTPAAPPVGADPARGPDGSLITPSTPPTPTTTPDATPATPDARDGVNQPAVRTINRDLDAQLERLRQRLRGEPDARAPRAIPGLPADTLTPRGGAQPGSSREPGDPRDPRDPRNASDPRNPLSTRTGGADRADQDQSGERSGQGQPGQGRRDTQDTDAERPLSANEALTPDVVRALRSVGGVKIDTLALRPVDPAGVRLTDETAYFGHMQGGEQALIDGRYFHAEDRFSRAMAAMPGDPMARIGRVHAQLGAGLFLSAAANLRSVFADHPEIIGATYGPALVPNNKRADRIADQLRADLRRNIAGLDRDAALLLAYLGQIRQDAPVVQEGLLEMTKRWNLNDPAEATLLETLRAAWAKDITQP